MQVVFQVSECEEDETEALECFDAKRYSLCCREGAMPPMPAVRVCNLQLHGLTFDFCLPTMHKTVVFQDINDDYVPQPTSSLPPEFSYLQVGNLFAHVDFSSLSQSNNQCIRT